MAIQNRRGVYSDFVPSKMVPGEFAVVQSGDPNATDGKGVYIAYSAGDVKRIAAYNEVQPRETGKGLSTNDYTTAEKNKLSGIAAGAEVNVQSDWNQTTDSADDYIKNKPSIPVIDNTLTQTGQAADAKKVGDEISDVKADLNDKADIIISTASGSIASFSDGADGLPVKSLKIGIEPVQDLHGYDNPWPAGGGKNILPPLTSQTKNSVTITVADDGTITVNGTASENTYFDAYFTGVIPSNTTFYLCAFNPVASTDSNNMSIFVITDNGNPQVNLNSVNAVTSYSYTSDKSISRWRLKVPSGVTYTNFIVKPMFQIGGNVPAVYEPYSNICPITGWTGANIFRSAENLAEDVVFTNGYYDDYGNIVSSTAMKHEEEYLPVISGKKYFISCDGNITNNRRIRVHEYDASKTWLRQVVFGDGNAKSVSWTASADAAYIRFSLANAAIRSTIVCAIGDILPITWQTEAGTVYDGSLDVTTGELVIDKAMAIFDGSNDESWQHYTVATGSLFRTTLSERESGKIYLEANRSKYLCNSYSASIDVNTDRTSGKFSGENKNVDFVNDNYTTVEGWRGYLAQNNIQFVYPLATPIEIQLDPVTLTTLLGQNNIWADTGDTEVQYRADTKKYIDSKITAAIAAALNS